MSQIARCILLRYKKITLNIMQFLKNFFWRWIFPLVLALVLYPYMLTIRIQLLQQTPEGLKHFKRDRKKSYIYAHWHEDIPILALRYAFRGFVSMASRSKDGELIARLLTLLGIKMVRGSTRHFGPETLEQILNAMRGRDLAFAVDGPKGPRHEVKPGVTYIAHKGHYSIIPVACNAKHKFVFHKSWDHMWFPIPFSKAVIICGEPIEFDGDLQRSLQTLKNQAQEFFLF
ncbi:MAG: hypothetical protein A2Z91_02565 [Deltaproteobacteria bacterium GWA2_38_16]|nr:MAG: hypothetical protein A2Z91_02565 [Deltaproteobacteria bacterium GWA2_38_16]OGQ02077.1 MAG: hypothetical protein A3D19_08860 [Deltaproteobacteria bacterium RIFCSPHIGHO2_02_FULL_38_15]OGQ63054.1 MAG: hypothetical protein A3G92_05355 [Deltaproteobacteria bacterium RIFCSPLOWO2_12_FULL_38_8]HBQ21614.1 hypothetical protein [Deltaproteobacteria bacterium]